MDDLPVFLQMFVRLLAVFALGAWLQSLTPHKSEKASSDHPTPAAKTSEQAPAKPCGQGPADTAK
ncbi:MAG TPA: hypothetical protein VHD32_10780 [Candidatus Didemnitutus sp.]|nr:hypothetical protein [Candidatus Didemnitutus sp.]